MQFYSPTLKKFAKYVRLAGNMAGLSQSEKSLQSQSSRWWSTVNVPKRKFYQHYREFFHDELWLEIGAESYRLYEQFVQMLDNDPSFRTVLEWGCGGGANAVHFAKNAEKFIGVDICDGALQECGGQLEKSGLKNYTTIKVPVESPGKIFESIPEESIDLFLCIYVFGVCPSEAYGFVIRKTAHRLLKKGGVALVQTKYPTSLATKSRRWGYRFGVASMTSYPIHQFWGHCQEAGLTPIAIHLKPKQDLVGDERYSYYLLRKD